MRIASIVHPVPERLVSTSSALTKGAIVTMPSLRSADAGEPILLERIVVLQPGSDEACGVDSARNVCVVVAIEAAGGPHAIGPVRGRAAALRHPPTTMTAVSGLQVHLPIEVIGSDVAQLNTTAGPMQPSPLASAVLAVVTAIVAAPPAPGTPSAVALEQSVLQLCRGLLAAQADERRGPDEPAAPRFVALRDTVSRLGVGGRVTIDAVAAELGTSTAEVRYALATGNTTFTGLVRECRLVALAERIRTDAADTPLTRLPSEVGIVSYPQAARAFKARFGMTMGEYRRFVRL